MIIAEIGQNHMGDMQLARKLVRHAKEGGADLVKFQLYDHKALYAGHPEIPNVELSFNDAMMLFQFGEQIGIEVFFSVFDVERVKWCERIGVKRYKIAASMRKKDVLMAVWDTHKPIITSVPNKHRVDFGVSDRFLYCPQGYPQTDISMPDFHETGYSGYSDHYIGLDAAKIAFARGAHIVEKHLALDHKTGVDAAWSMDITELKELKHWENVCKEIL